MTHLDEHDMTHRLDNVNRESKRHMHPMTMWHWAMYKQGTSLTERQQLDSYFALRARLRGFFKYLPIVGHALTKLAVRSQYVHFVLQTCKWCDMPHNSDRPFQSGICNSCLEMKYGQNK